MEFPFDCATGPGPPHATAERCCLDAGKMVQPTIALGGKRADLNHAASTGLKLPSKRSHAGVGRRESRRLGDGRSTAQRRQEIIGETMARIGNTGGAGRCEA